MAEKILQEQVDKYRVEYNRGTTGGKIGFSVRATGDDKEKVMAEAIAMAARAISEADALGTSYEAR